MLCCPPPLQALGFLNYLMLGTAAAPLRKALNDSGLGESIIGGGIEDELRQPVFSLGLKVWRLLLPPAAAAAAEATCAATAAAAAAGKATFANVAAAACRRHNCRPASTAFAFALLQGVKEEDAAKVESLILDTLVRLEMEGFSQSAVEAAVNTIEFSLR